MGKYCALKKTQQTNKPSPQYLFQIICLSLKAVVTSLEHFSNPAEHNSVELLPQESAVSALTGSDPRQNAPKTSASTSLQSQTAEPTPLRAIQNLPVPSLPFPRCPLGGVPASAKAAPCLSPLSQRHQAWGRRGALLALPGRAEAE